MKKTIIILCFLTLGVNIHAQVAQKYDRYNNMIDSLFICFLQETYYDLSLSGYTMPEQIQMDEYKLVLEVFFISKRSNILALYAFTDAMKKKFYKQNKGFRFITKAFSQTFRRNIQESGKLPFDIIDYFSYKFILPYEKSPNKYAIYGEYIFRPNEKEELEISEKKVELLQDEDAFLRKCQMSF